MTPLHVHGHLKWHPSMSLVTFSPFIIYVLTHPGWPPFMSSLTRDDPPLCPHSPLMTPFYVLTPQNDPPLCPRLARLTPLYDLTQPGWPPSMSAPPRMTPLYVLTLPGCPWSPKMTPLFYMSFIQRATHAGKLGPAGGQLALRAMNGALRLRGLRPIFGNHIYHVDSPYFLNHPKWCPSMSSLAPQDPTPLYVPTNFFARSAVGEAALILTCSPSGLVSD